MINRRAAIRLLSAGLIGPLLARNGLTASRNPDLDDPARLLEVFMRLSGSLDDRLIIWWMDGFRYGVVDARARLLFGMKVGMFHRFFAQPDGSFKVAMFELTYYTDLATGELLESFDNPYTGETNKVTHVKLGPEIRHQTQTGTARPDSPMVAAYRSSLGPALVNGDDIWIPTGVNATIRFPKAGAPSIELNHYTTVHGRLDDAVNPDLQSAPAQFNFQNVIKWEPFMRMGDYPGHMMSRAAGRKLESVAELPSDYLAIARRLHPRYIADPVAALDALLRES